MRIPYALGVGLCLAFGWGGNFSAQEPGKEKKDAVSFPYKMELLKVGDSYQGLKYKPPTGETWQIGGEKWLKIAESAPCSAGDYQITLIPTETGFMAFRMERFTGMTSILNNRNRHRGTR